HRLLFKFIIIPLPLFTQNEHLLIRLLSSSPNEVSTFYSSFISVVIFADSLQLGALDGFPTVNLR
ncbi:hypothetical protein, partial [Paenibacillus qinlingensis]|uniref:hypothetical protein n=1 Tax=Paenibacillus qinlingensis TaxID=1837343 RepID=UPI001C2052D3